MRPAFFVACLVAFAIRGQPCQADARQAPVRQCIGAQGQTIFTDRSCAAIDAAETSLRSRSPAVGLARPYRGGCARDLDALSHEVASAIDLQDANRLAGSYHWVGMDTRNGYRVMARLEALVRRPLLDIAPTGGTSEAEPRWEEDAEGNLLPIYPKPRPPNGLLLLQSAGRDGSATLRTTFGLRRHLGCLWISF